MDTTAKPRDRRLTIGVGLLFAALALLAAGKVMWDNATDEAESDRRTAELAQAMLIDDGNPAAAAEIDTDIDPDRTAATGAFAAAGLAAVCGTIILSTSRSRDPGVA